MGKRHNILAKIPFEIFFDVHFYGLFGFKNENFNLGMNL